ncbi:MAG TPA: hypothetical protein VMW79_11875 [Anaerolineae bacterium]|nr:hypothetical protein [Anaerolineae bacterium]
MNERIDNRSMLEAADGEQTDHIEAQLAGDIMGLYPAVHPERAFRGRLHDDLLATMRCRAKLQVVLPPERRRWALIAGATVGSLVPLVGLAAYLVRSRYAGGPQRATSR